MNERRDGKKIAHTNRLARHWMLVSLAGYFSIVGIGRSQGTTIAVPGIYGPTSSVIPFSGLTLTDVPPLRLQQVYGASAFSSTMPQGGYITGLVFVSDLLIGRQWSAPLPKVEILIGMTSKAPDGLSTTFSENLGPSMMPAHSLGPINISSDGAGAPVRIVFQTPFFYRPADGNLLIDIKNFEPTLFPGAPQLNAGSLEAFDVLGDPISRVYARNVTSPTGTADSLGLTTFFVVNPIPEPSSIALLLAGLGSFGLLWKRNRQRKK